MKTGRSLLNISHRKFPIFMVLLGRSRILELLRSGELRIEPSCSRSQIGAGSIDLRLGNEFRVFKKVHGVFSVTNKADFGEITERIRVSDRGQMLIMPGELVHGITKERVTLPMNMAGFIEGRSSLARVGLLAHLSSGFVHPGTSNRTVLEIANISPFPVSIKPGLRICQLVLLESSCEEKYKGRFASQINP